MDPKRLADFTFLKAESYFAGRWRTCIPACRRRQTCTGGPRGTCWRFGRPVCAREVGSPRGEEGPIARAALSG